MGLDELRTPVLSPICIYILGNSLDCLYVVCVCVCVCDTPAGHSE